jgi:glycosyltransferase involved in cell wall biosynthesis
VKLVAAPVTARPMVSVLVRIYNGQAYLSDCLESILASTWQDLEVVVVDGRSTDGSLATAERFAKDDSRVHVSAMSTISVITRTARAERSPPAGGILSM